MFSNISPHPENHAVYEKMWENVVEPDSPHDNPCCHTLTHAWHEKRILFRETSENAAE